LIIHKCTIRALLCWVSKMRLLNVDTGEMREFFDDERPSYAILSHTWGNDEITFEHCKDASGVRYRKGSSAKIDGCCLEARARFLKWVWIDTVCIDKSSSAELSEAINSMFAWYRRAHVCFAYLSDVPNTDVPDEENSAFRNSRWFTRGWTLQELLAPRRLVFYSQDWIQINQRNEASSGEEVYPGAISQFTSLLSDITGIEKWYLVGDMESVRSCCIGAKLSWAAGRSTKRVEDRAYSLLGLLGVNMPMLYGEGYKAFARLLKEAMDASDDHSIFAGGFGLPGDLDRIAHNSIFPAWPDSFSKCTDLGASRLTKTGHYYFTNRGLHIEVLLTELLCFSETAFAQLNVVIGTHVDICLAWPLVPVDGEEDTYFITPLSRPADTVLRQENMFAMASRKRIYIQPPPPWFPRRQVFGMPEANDTHLTVATVYPHHWTLHKDSWRVTGPNVRGWGQPAMRWIDRLAGKSVYLCLIVNPSPAMRVVVKISFPKNATRGHGFKIEHNGAPLIVEKKDVSMAVVGPHVAASHTQSGREPKFLDFLHNAERGESHGRVEWKKDLSLDRGHLSIIEREAQWAGQKFTRCLLNWKLDSHREKASGESEPDIFTQ
jgi:hypothetical protein